MASGVSMKLARNFSHLTVAMTDVATLWIAPGTVLRTD